MTEGYKQKYERTRDTLLKVREHLAKARKQLTTKQKALKAKALKLLDSEVKRKEGDEIIRAINLLIERKSL